MSIKLLDIVELQNKLAHIKALARVLLPYQTPELCDMSQELFEDADFNQGVGSMPLSQMRKRCISAGIHEFSWDVAIHSCPLSFKVGDIGYIRHDDGRLSLTNASRFDQFVKAGSIFDEPPDKEGGRSRMDSFSLVREVAGAHCQWINGFYKSRETCPFAAPGEAEG